MALRLSLIFAFAMAVSAQPPRSVSDGVYTLPQAERGHADYTRQCANCHGTALAGGDEAPGLIGVKFLAKWKGHTVDELFRNMLATMPADRPGTLTRPANADLVAYILSANNLRAGAMELSPESSSLKQIRFGTGPEVVAGPASSPNTDPAPAMIEGKPIQTLPTEKPDNKPAFPQQTRAPYHGTPAFKVTTLADNMPAPFGLSFLPGGNILLTYKLPGSIHLLDTKGVLSKALTGLAGIASPAAKDIGLLDVIPDPKYASNHQIFFTFFEYVDGTDSNTYVGKAFLDEARATLTEAKVIFRTVPAIPTKRLGSKTGGRIVFAPDGSLFFSTGDRSDSPPWEVAQHLDSHLGKILHITADGAPAPDNPFLGKTGILPEIWAYGLRNPEGLAYDPSTGRLWENEHGPRGGDELNIIEKGRNYGWPVITHGIDYPGTVIGDNITRKAGMEEPIYYWDPVIAPSGLAFYSGKLFPQWQGSLFVGGLRARMLVRLKIVNDKVTEEEPLLMNLQARIRDVRVGPDGAVYVLTDSGGASMSPNTPLASKLLKLTPK